MYLHGVTTPLWTGDTGPFLVNPPSQWLSISLSVLLTKLWHFYCAVINGVLSRPREAWLNIDAVPLWWWMFRRGISETVCNLLFNDWLQRDVRTFCCGEKQRSTVLVPSVMALIKKYPELVPSKLHCIADSMHTLSSIFKILHTFLISKLLCKIAPNLTAKCPFNNKWT